MTPPKFVLFVAALLISACATLSKEDCVRGDWYKVGLRDGQMGDVAERLDFHQRVCAQFHLKPDRDLYQKGREEGLKQYCSPANAFSMGKSCAPYKTVCPDYLENRFQARYMAGQMICKLVTEIGSLHEKVVSLQNRLIKENAEYWRQALHKQLREMYQRRDKLQRELTFLQVKEDGVGAYAEQAPFTKPSRTALN